MTGTGVFSLSFNILIYVEIEIYNVIKKKAKFFYEVMLYIIDLKAIRYIRINL